MTEPVSDPQHRNENIAGEVFYGPTSSRSNWLKCRAELSAIGKEIAEGLSVLPFAAKFMSANIDPRHHG